MHRITLILILFLLLPDMYIYLVYIVKKTRNIVWRSTYWLPTAMLVAIYMYYIYMTGDNALSHHPQGIGRLAVAVMLFAVPKTVFMLCSLLGILMRGISRLLSLVIFRTPFRSPRSPFVAHRLPYTLLGLILGGISFANILYGAIAGITRFEVKDVEYRSANIPKGFDGYRILQLSDIHIGSWLGNPEAVRHLVKLVNEQKADLIVFTGDLVNQQSHELDGFKEILSRLHAPDGVYSILGNHDYGTYYRWRNRKEEAANLEYLIEQQKEMGWKMLNNEHDILYHKGDSIALIGVENDGEPPFSQSHAGHGRHVPYPAQPQPYALATRSPAGLGYRVNPFRAYARHADGNVRTFVSFSHLPGMGGYVLRRQTSLVCQCRHRICGTAFPLRCMARNHRYKIS